MKAKKAIVNEKVIANEKEKINEKVRGFSSTLPCRIVHDKAELTWLPTVKITFFTDF